MSLAQQATRGTAELCVLEGLGERRARQGNLPVYAISERVGWSCMTAPRCQ